MANTRVFIFIFLILLGGIAAGIIWKSNPTSLCSHLRCIRIDNASSYHQQDVYSDTKSIYRALYSADKRFLRIEAQRTSPQSAPQELDAAIAKVQAMYEKAPAPYPGEISDAVVCDPSFIPTYEEVKRNETKTALFVGYLNNRMTFGSCSQNQAVYRGVLALTYCPQQSLLLRLELISPTSDFEQYEKEFMDQIRSLQCGK